MRANPLVCFPYSEWMTSPLDGGHVQSWGPASAKRDVWGICRVSAIFSRIFVESDLESGIDRRRVCHGSCIGAATRSRWDHHSAGDADKKVEMSDVGSIKLGMAWRKNGWEEGKQGRSM